MPELKEDIFAVPDGEIYPRKFCAGEDVGGAVASAADEQGKLVVGIPAEKAVPSRKSMKSPENK